MLTSLDISNNPILKYLYCNDNELTGLDISNNPELYNLKCYNNKLTSLDVSNNLNLGFLYCYNNELMSLNLSLNTNCTGALNMSPQTIVLEAIRDDDSAYITLPNTVDTTKIINLVGGTISQRGIELNDVAPTETTSISYEYNTDHGNSLMTVNITIKKAAEEETTEEEPTTEETTEEEPTTEETTEEKPTAEETTEEKPTAEELSSADTTTPADSVQTGDKNTAFIYILACILGLLVMLFAPAVRKRDFSEK